MKKKSVFLSLVCLVLLLSGAAGCWQATAVMAADTPALDVVLRITDFERALSVIDELAAETGGGESVSPALQIQGLFQGTDWIDSRRTLTVGLRFGNGQPDATVLVPFKTPNENFKAAYNASEGAGYYLLSFPPGMGSGLPADIEQAMVAASRKKTRGLFSVEIACQGLLQNGESQIFQALQNMESSSAGMAPQPFAPRPEDIRAMVEQMITIARQLDRFTVGIDSASGRLTTTFELETLPDTPLARLFSSAGTTSRFTGYLSDSHINFRSKRYDIHSMLGFFSQTFGPMYQAMGMDISGFVDLGRHFTGEAAGGFSVEQGGVEFEMILVLSDPDHADTFLENVYLPFLEQYSVTLAGTLEKQLGQPVPDLFVRTADSTVAGYPVYGLKGQTPIPTAPGISPAEAPAMDPMNYDMRLTTVGNLLLIASNDRRLKTLIDLAGTLKSAPDDGPLAVMDMDLSGYLSAIRNLIPVATETLPPVPVLGKAVFEYDLKDGVACAAASFPLQDISTMATYFSAIGQQTARAMGDASEPAVAAAGRQRLGAEGEKPEKQIVRPATEDNADYWFEQGALCSTYGNDACAIKYFQRAIQLNSNHAKAHFQMGVSYGEIGQYRNALSAINRAIAINPENGRFYYGRGRVRLLAGDEDGALADFHQAARRGEQDAINYLKRSATGEGN